MDWRRYEAELHRRWQLRMAERLRGLSFDEACRKYVLYNRPPQYISAPAAGSGAECDGRGIRTFRPALKSFPSEDPARKHCLSREELIAETSRITGLPEGPARSLLYRLFAFQPELTFGRRGALCGGEFAAGFDPLDVKTVSIPYPALEKELPEEWYISLQIPEALIDRMVWGVRKAGRTAPCPCSSRFAGSVLRLGKRCRGGFIRECSFEELKFLWLEYPSMAFPRTEVEKTVRELLSLL